MINKNKIKLLFKSDFVRKVAETFATRIFLLLLGLVTSAIITRMLEPKGRGLVAAATTVTAIGVQFGNLGLHSSNTYYVAKNPKILGTLIGNSLLISFGAVGVIICFLYGVFITWPQISPVQDSLLVLTLISIPISLAYMLLQNLLLGIHQSNKYNQIERITGLLSILLISLLILFDEVSPSRAYIVSLVVPCIGICLVLLNLKPHTLSELRPSIKLIKQHFGYGFKVYTACFFAFMVIRFDMLMIQYMLGPEELGYYSIAVGLIDKALLIPGAVGAILFPRLTSLSTYSEKWQVTKKILIPFTFVMLGLITLMFLIGKTLILFLYGSQYLPALLPYKILLIGIYFLSINTVLMNYLASQDMPLITIISPGIATILNIVMNIKLIPFLGIVGASISSIISYGLMLFFSLIFIYNDPQKNYKFP